MSSAGPGTKNDFAGEDQQELTQINPEGNRPLGRPRRIWEDNIEIGRREMGQGAVDCINLAYDRDQWRVLVNMNLRIS
jgi:hypothetical protein